MVNEEYVLLLGTNPVLEPISVSGFAVPVLAVFRPGRALTDDATTSETNAEELTQLGSEHPRGLDEKVELGDAVKDDVAIGLGVTDTLPKPVEDVAVLRLAVAGTVVPTLGPGPGLEGVPDVVLLMPLSLI